jgi:hypothetical protein
MLKTGKSYGRILLRILHFLDGGASADSLDCVNEISLLGITAACAISLTTEQTHA